MAEKTDEEIRREYVSRVMDPRTYGIEPGSLATPAGVNDAITRLRSGGVNILGPECRIDYIPRLYQPSLRWAFFDRRADGVWYPQAGGGYSLHYVSLNQLAMLAGITWGSVERDDDGRTPLYWRVRLSASVKLFDGTPKPEQGLGEADLRDGSAEALKVLADAKGDARKAEGNLLRMRAKGSQRCESIAKAGLIRKLLAVRAKYSEREADMPFVWPALIFVPPADPELDRLIALKEMGLLGDVYGPPKRTIIDIAPTPAALPDHGAPVDFAAEQARLDARQRVPVTHADVGGAPKGWEGTEFPLAVVREWCNAKGGKWAWRDGASPERIAWLVAYLTSDAGRADIRGFVGVAR